MIALAASLQCSSVEEFWKDYSTIRVCRHYYPSLWLGNIWKAISKTKIPAEKILQKTQSQRKLLEGNKKDQVLERYILPSGLDLPNRIEIITF